MNDMSDKSPYVQDYMQGNTCFGCGKENPEGLQIKSYWQDEQCLCIWKSEDKYEGFQGILNGGILATVVDCHTMATAASYAYRSEDRFYDTEPTYTYATGSMAIRYLKPTPNDQELTFRAQVTEAKGRKTQIHCEVWANSEKTAEAEVVAIRVFDSSQAHGQNPFHR